MKLNLTITSTRNKNQFQPHLRGEIETIDIAEIQQATGSSEAIAGILLGAPTGDDLPGGGR